MVGVAYMDVWAGMFSGFVRVVLPTLRPSWDSNASQAWSSWVETYAALARWPMLSDFELFECRKRKPTNIYTSHSTRRQHEAQARKGMPRFLTLCILHD
jgi:hypothetical protein